MNNYFDKPKKLPCPRCGKPVKVLAKNLRMCNECRSKRLKPDLTTEGTYSVRGSIKAAAAP